jgi:death-on-curing family protein
MTIVHTVTAEAVININRLICTEGVNQHQCYGIGKVESALHSAFYPGGYPFQHGGIARISGALCFYLTQAHAFYDGNKRTALITSLTFLDINGWDLKYPLEVDGRTAVAAVIERCAEGKATKEEMMTWFDWHKVR